MEVQLRNMTDGPKEPSRIHSAISDKTDQRGIAKTLELQRQKADLSHDSQMQDWRLKQTKYQKVINLRKQLALAEKELHQMDLIQGWDEEPEITTLEEQAVYWNTFGNKDQIQ